MCGEREGKNPALSIDSRRSGYYSNKHFKKEVHRRLRRLHLFWSFDAFFANQKFGVGVYALLRSTHKIFLWLISSRRTAHYHTPRSLEELSGGLFPVPLFDY